MPSKHKFAHWRYNTAKGRKTRPTTHFSRALTIEKTEFIGRNFTLKDYDTFRKPHQNQNPLRVKWATYRRPSYSNTVTSTELQEILKTTHFLDGKFSKFFECQKAPRIEQEVKRSESLTVPGSHGRNSIGTLESLDESEYEDLNESQDIVFNNGREV